MHHPHLDSAGVTLSGICLVHCLVLPLLATLLPASGQIFDDSTNHLIHWVLLGLALPISIMALGRGARVLRARIWLTIGSVGLALMTIAVVTAHASATEEHLTLSGVVLLAGAHLGNWFDPRRRRATAG